MVKLKTRTKQEKHNHLIRLVRLGLLEQAEIMSIEIYAEWSIDTALPPLALVKAAGPYSVIRTTSWNGTTAPYIVFYKGWT